MSLTTGTRVGPYEILSALGAGGMGEVYKARDTRLDRTVAIKILPETLAADPQFRERFDREARAISQLDHPNICTLFDVGEVLSPEPGTSHEPPATIRFLVMQYLEGETLEARLKNGALPFDQALKTAIEIASALDKAHRAGIVHRDLKPGNIMLTKAGAKLLDFGLAKASPAKAGLYVPAADRSVRLQPDGSMLPTTPPNLTAQGTILGTFQYMAPEQLEGQDADARTDIFAFGAVVYEMLTGKKAFTGKSQASLIGAILHAEPLPISTLQPLTPKALHRIIRKCLAKDPAERWQSTKDLHDELQWIGGEGDASVSSVSTIAGGTKPGTSRVAWGVAAVLLLTTLGLGAALFLARAGPDPLVTRLDVSTPPTTDPFSFALSPDGRQIVFVADGENRAELWVRSFDQSTAHRLAGTTAAEDPFWSPDGRSLGFFADGKLKRLDLAAGTVQVLGNAPSPRGGAWAPDGTIIFSRATTGGLMRIAATGGNVTELTQLRRAGSHRWPQVLPDGRHFLFTLANGSPEDRGVYLGSLDGGQPSRILATEGSPAYLAPGFLLQVSTQGTLVARRFDVTRRVVNEDPIPIAESVGVNNALARGAFSVSASGVFAYRSGATLSREIVWTDRAGKTLGIVVRPDDTALAGPNLAPDGMRFALNRTVAGNSDVWVGDTARGIVTRLTDDVSADSQPVWSPDGAQIIFRSARNKGQTNLFEKPADGATEDRPLLVDEHNEAPLSWSSDGRFLLFAQNDDQTLTDLWVLPLTGDRKSFPFVKTTYDEVHGQFSPDGRWIAYASNDTGRYEIYIRPFPGPGSKWQVSTRGGFYPRWSADSKEVFFVAPDNAMMASTIQAAPGGGTLKVGTPVSLFLTRMAVGANNGIGGYLSSAQYAVARDGRFLIIDNAGDATSLPLTIVLNWTAELKK